MRELLGATLAEAADNVLVDMEASVEHMRRATIRHTETLLVVAEPYYRALESAGRLVRLARELELPRILGVANKVRSEREAAAVETYFAGLEVPVVAVIPFDDAVSEADFEGRPLLDFRPDAPAVRALEDLAREIWN